MILRSILVLTFLLNAFSVSANECKISDQIEMCTSAFHKGQESTLEKVKDSEAISTAKKHQLRNYEIEDTYLAAAKDTIWWKNSKLIAYSSVFNGATSIFSLFITVYSSKIFEKLGIAQNQGTQATSTVILGTVLAKELEKAIEFLKTTAPKVLESGMVAIGAQAAPKEVLDPEIEILAFQLKYEEWKDTLPKNYQSKIEATLDQMQTRFVKNDPNQHRMSVELGSKLSDGDKTLLSNELKIIEVIFKLPRQLKAIHKKDYIAKLEALLVNYDHDVQSKIRELVAGIETNSKPKIAFNPFEKIGTAPTRRVIYLLGPPGTGKTYLGQRFADTLGLPFIQMSALDLKDLALAQRKRDGYDKPSPLKLTEHLSNLPNDKRFKNIVIFVDEFDKIMMPPSSSGYSSSSEVSDNQLQSFFLEFFDREKSLFKLNDIDVELDMSSIIFILAGNKALTDSSNAMVARLRTIEFGPLSFDNRLNIACQLFGQKSALIDAEDDQKTEIEKEIPRIVDVTIKDTDTNLGIKSLLKTIEDFSDHLEMKLHGSKESFDVIERLEHHSKIMWDPQVAFANFKRAFEKSKNTLYSGVVDDTEKRIVKLKIYLEQMGSNRGANPQKTMKSIFNNLEYTLQLPAPVKNLVEDESKIEERLESFLGENYPNKMKDKIRKIVQRHIEASADPASSSRNVAYFFGEPGLGKSSVAKGLAEAMGLPVIELRLQGNSVEKLIGSRGFISFPDFMEEDLTLSELTSQVLAAQDGLRIPSNAILLINEVDTEINGKDGESSPLKSFLLNDLLDPDRKELKLNDLRLPIDISNFLIIMTGNRVLMEENAKGISQRSAINDRLDLLEFTEFTEIGMKNIAKKILDKQTAGVGFDANFADEMASAYYKLGIKSLRPFEKQILTDYANCLKKAKRTGTNCEFDYKDGLQRIQESEDTLAKHNKAKKEAEPEVKSISDL